MDQHIAAQITARVTDNILLRAQANSLHHDDPARITILAHVERNHRRITELCEREAGPDAYYFRNDLGERPSIAS